MNSTLRWTMISLALGAFGVVGCSSTDNGDGGTTTSSTGSSTTTTTAGTSTGSSTGSTTAGSTSGTTTGGSTGTGTTTGGSTTGGSTSGEHYDAGNKCWENPVQPKNILNGCTNAQGVSLPTVLLPCWDGGITTTSSFPNDFPAPGQVSGWTCN